ncbi:MAG: hypothetical protein IKD27_08950 [Oscillospiraceae bacterium]|nr:hypothetical protein [Oscillospiraceae bacterium]
MFVKLLKHEWRANRGLIGLLCAVIGGSGLLSGGLLRYMVWNGVTGNEAAVAIYTFVLAAVLIVGVISFILPTYLLVYRFYQSRFTDRGYLMLTLPVTTHQQLLSSIICTVIGVALVSVTALASYAAGITFFLSMFNQSGAAELMDRVSMAISDAGKIGVLFDFYWIPALIAFLADIILLMLAVTVGAHVNEHPVMKGAAVYILTDFVVNEVCTMINEMSGYPVGMMCISLIYFVLAVGAYFIMHHIIDKRLNLT